MTAERIAPNLSYLATTTVDSDVQALVQRPNDTAYKLGSLDKQIGKPLPGQVLNLNTGNLEYFNLNPQGLAVNPEFTPPSPAGPEDPGRPPATVIIPLTIEDKQNGAKADIIAKLEGLDATVWSELDGEKYMVIIGDASIGQVEAALTGTNYHPQAIILPQFPTPTAIEGDITSSNEQVTAESEQGIEWQRYQYLDHDPDPRDIYNLNSYTGEEEGLVEIEFATDTKGFFHHTYPNTNPDNEDSGIDNSEHFDLDGLLKELCGEGGYFEGAICLYRFDENNLKITFKIHGQVETIIEQRNKYKQEFHNPLQNRTNIISNLPPEVAREEISTTEQLIDAARESKPGLTLFLIAFLATGSVAYIIHKGFDNS